VPVQTELDSPGRVAAYLDEERTEVFVINVEVVVVDIDRLVTVELELSVDLPSIEGLGFLLCDPNEDNAIACTPFSPKPIRNMVFLFLVRKRMDGICSRSAKAFTASRNFSVICPSTTGEGIGSPS
jgi:hypothetical protein